MASNIPALTLSKLRKAAYVPDGFSRDYFRTLEIILEQIQDQVGVEQGQVSADSIASTSAGEAIRVFSEIASLKYSYVDVSGSHTTSGNEFVNVTASSTVLLNNEPDDNEKAIIRIDGDFNCVISGNGRNINGESTVTIFIEKTSLNIIYNLNSDAWFIV